MSKTMENKCPNCDSVRVEVDSRRGETICRKCGYILEDNAIDFTAEWVASEDSEDKIRAGAPLQLSRADSGVRTMIGSRSDLSKLGGKARTFQKLQKQDIRASTKTERNLKYAFDDLHRFISLLHLSKTVEEEAARIYRQALDKNLIRGRTVEAVVAVSIYLACKAYGIPKSFRELCEISKVNPKDFGKTLRFVSRKLKLKMAPSNPTDFIPKFASVIGLKPVTQAKAVEILKKAQKAEIDNGRGPLGLVAAALYIAAQLTGAYLTQKQVADATEVTEVTIRNRYKEIVTKLNLKPMVA